MTKVLWFWPSRRLRPNAANSVLRTEYSARRRVPSPLLSLAVHLKPPDGLEGVTVVRDERFAAVGGPTDRQHVEAGGVAEQAALLQVVQCQVREPALLGGVHRFGGPGRVGGAGRAHLDEDDAVAVEGD